MFEKKIFIAILLCAFFIKVSAMEPSKMEPSTMEPSTMDPEVSFFYNYFNPVFKYFKLYSEEVSANAFMSQINKNNIADKSVLKDLLKDIKSEKYRSMIYLFLKTSLRIAEIERDNKKESNLQSNLVKAWQVILDLDFFDINKSVLDKKPLQIAYYYSDVNLANLLLENEKIKIEYSDYGLPKLTELINTKTVKTDQINLNAIYTLILNKIRTLKSNLFDAIKNSKQDNFQTLESGLMKLGKFGKYVKDDNGNNILHYAIASKNREYIHKILLIAPDLLLLKNKNNLTPFDQVIQNSKPDDLKDKNSLISIIFDFGS